MGGMAACSAPRQGDLNGLSTVAELPIVPLHANHPNASRNLHIVDIAGEGLFVGMSVQELALPVDHTILAHDANRVCVALWCVIGRRNRDIEVECLWPTGLNLCSDDIGILLCHGIGRP